MLHGRKPIVTPPGVAVSVRGLGVAYYVRGFESSILSQPTPLRSADEEKAAGARRKRNGGGGAGHRRTDRGDDDGGRSRCDDNVSPFSYTLQHRFRYSLREAEVVQLLDQSDCVVIGHSTDEGLRRLTWGGAPPSHRAECWRVLLEVSPATQRLHHDQRAKTLQRKRGEYHDYVSRYFSKDKPISDRGPQERQILHQLALDLPRHKFSLFRDPRTVHRLERCLFLWSLRHPAVGFVQGIDDIMVQFFFVFLGEAFERRFLQLQDALRRRQHRHRGGGALQQRPHHPLEMPPPPPRAVVLSTPPPPSPSRVLQYDVGVVQASAEEQESAHAANVKERGGSSLSSSLSIRRDVSPPIDAAPIDASTATGGGDVVEGEGGDDDDGLLAALLSLADGDKNIDDIFCWQTAFSKDDDVFSKAVTALMLRPCDLDAVEADTYWCGGRMLSWVQDNFVFRQPGLAQMMQDFMQLVATIDGELMYYLNHMEVMLGQACFQWFHCLLTRELPERLVVRLWDVYMSIGPEFRRFHLYVCVALLEDIRAELLPPVGAFDVIMTRLKAPKPVEMWASMTDEWMESLIASAYLLSVKHPMSTARDSNNSKAVVQ